MIRNLMLVITVLFLSIPSAWAQPRRLGGIDHHLFPAELVMRHYQEINLSDSQQKAIRAEMKKVQNKLFDLQWELEKATGGMEKLVSQDTVKEEAVLAQMDKVLKLEQKIKRARLIMLVRIRNILMPKQRSKLKEYRTIHRPRLHRPGGFDDPRKHRPVIRPEGEGPRPLLKEPSFR